MRGGGGLGVVRVLGWSGVGLGWGWVRCCEGVGMERGRTGVGVG